VPVPLSAFLQKCSGIAILIVGSFLAYQFALLTWALFPAHEDDYQWVIPKTSVTNSKIDTRVLQQQHLFGKVFQVKKVAQPVKSVSVAPKTKLNLILVGVVAASDPNYSSAIISYKSKQGSYFIDSEIEGTQASVSEIYADRVILNVEGALQTLMLDGVDGKTASKPTRQSRVNQSRTKEDREEQEPVEVELDRQEILDDPSKLTDYVRISPYREDGQVLGYRLRPGKNPTLFEQAGLEKNDLAVELNGVDLLDTQQAFSLMKEFPTMTEINVTVERDGQLHELSLNIP
jgi:general secretion pathway protein C